MEKHTESERANNIQISRVNSFEYTYKWIIENFSTYISLPFDLSILQSDIFYPEPNVWWYAKIQMASSGLDIYLYRDCRSDADLQWKLSVFEKNKILWEESKEVHFSRTDDYKCISISQDELAEINEFKASDTIIFVIHLNIFRVDTRTLMEFPTDTQFSEDSQNSLCQDLTKMYDDQLCTDISLKIQGETVGAHKAILSARSPVFARMFQQQMAESQSQAVNIPDINMDTFKELLAFIYSGQRRDYDFETSLDVYCAADKYEVLKLKEVCRLILIREIDSENFIELLQLADRHGDAVLKAKALQFLRSYFTICVESENWIQFQNEESELYKEVIKYINV